MTGVQTCALPISFTYLAEHDVFAWAHHDSRSTDLFKSVSCVSRDDLDEDATYVIVERRINGYTVQLIERLVSRYFDAIQDCWFVDAALQYNSPKTITNITSANPPVVSCVGHGLTTGSIVNIDEVIGCEDDNGDSQVNEPNRFWAKVTDADHFTLADYETGVNIDGSAWSTYRSGGVARKCTASVTGLWHLEGETVSILADGNVEAQQTVSGGSVTISRSAGRIAVGLPYQSDFESLPLDFNTGLPTIQGVRKTIPYITLRLKQSRGFFIGPNEDDLKEFKQRGIAGETYNQPTALLTGDVQVPMTPKFSTDGTVFIRQTDPLPLTILGLVPEVQLGAH